MEAIGIAASFIAIGQALLAGRHVVNLLQEIPKIGNELASLNNEIESLRAALEAANPQGMQFHDNETEGPDLRLARGQITDISNMLETIRLKCIKVGKNGKIKPRMARLFLVQNELQACRSKARDAREALNLALTILSLKTVQTLHIENVAIRTAGYHDSESSVDPEIKGYNTLASGFAFGSGFSNEENHTNPAQERETEVRLLSLMSSDERSSDDKTLVGMDMVIWKARLSGAGKCPRQCRCRCHSSRPSTVRYPGWIGTLIGSLSVTYDKRLLLRGNNECTELNCKSNRRSSATLGFQLPTWLCAQFVSYQVYMDSFRELRYSLRSVRVVPTNYSTILAIEMHRREAVKGSMLAYGHLFTDDRIHLGRDVMTIAMNWATPDTLEFLIELWAEHLRKDTYHPNWFFSANRALRRHDFSAQKTTALRLIASFGEDIVDAPQTELHKAVDLDEPATNNHDFQRIVTKYPWTIDQWNHEGLAPLALAAQNGNLHAVRELVRLGCNIDQPDYRGVTPLMEASANGHVDVVQFLLDAGCSVNVTSGSGNTALFFAADQLIETAQDPGTIMQMLLSAGASVKISNLRGNTPLHMMGLSGSEKLSRRAAMTKIRLLLEAGADINAMSHGKSRPLERAISYDQPELMKCLIEAGAQVTELSGKQNLLHLAAKEARLETLQHLADMQLPFLNVSQEDEWGNTPWDDFVRVLHSPERDLSASRRPTSPEQDAFVTLYKKLQVQSLSLDISRLQRIHQHLEGTTYHGALMVLQSLISEKRDWKQWESLRTYETIRLQVQEQMVDAALESVDENIEVLQEKIDASPWDQVSYWDPSKATISYGHEGDTESE